MRTKIVLATLFCLGLMACGGGNFNGNYSGTWSLVQSGSTSPDTTFTATMYQSGSNVSGVFVASGTTTPISGTISGTASGSSLNSATLTIESQSGQATSALTGTLTLSGSSLTGSLSGTENGSSATATLNVTQSQ